MKKQKLVSIDQYISLLDGLGIKITPQALHARKMRGKLEFVIGGDTPSYKIDTHKYPPEEFTIEKRGRKKSTT